MKPTPTAYRRSPALVCYWRGDQQYCFSSAAARQVPVTPEAVAILQNLSTWTTAEALAKHLPGEAYEVVEELLETFAELTLVERSCSTERNDVWSCWAPEAAFFHFSTRDQPYQEDRTAIDAALSAKALIHPPPPPTKRVCGPRVSLPRMAPLGEVEAVLKRRRTWRHFSAAPLPQDALGTLLDLSCRVQRWGQVEGQGPIPLKTSPSAGARHPTETYVVALNVEGLASGAYHYDAADGALVDLRRRVTPEQVSRLIAYQTHCAAAAALFVFTSVFERAMWKYPFPRAYRALLLDVGHMCQTLCLVATALGLAPFTTMAFFESPLEEMLGVDGRRESVLYVAGVGMAPVDVVNPGWTTG